MSVVELLRASMQAAKATDRYVAVVVVVVVVCRLLFDGCCLLFVVCCFLFVVCCLLFGVVGCWCCLLLVLLFVVSWCLVLLYTEARTTTIITNNSRRHPQSTKTTTLESIAVDWNDSLMLALGDVGLLHAKFDCDSGDQRWRPHH